MAETPLQREYTVHEDEDGREYFLQPQSKNTVLKVYLDQAQQDGETGDDVIYVQPGQNDRPVKGPQQVLLVPANNIPQSPPPNQRNEEPTHIVYQNPEPEHKEPQTIYVTQPPEKTEQEQPEIIYIQAPVSNGKLEPVEEENTQPNIIYVQQEPEPQTEPEPQIIYIQETPRQQPQPETPQPQVIVLREPPRTPVAKQRRRIPVWKSPPSPQRSEVPSLSPQPRYERKQRNPPKYQPGPKPDQATARVGGMLVIDNDPWKPKAKVDHRNPNYHRSGGNVPILNDRIAWDGRPRVDDWNNNYKRGGGDVVILHENLKWRKNARKIRRPGNQYQGPSGRSVSSENVREGAESPVETVSEGVPSRAVEPLTMSYPDYSTPRKTKGSYANQFKGKIHRYNGGPQNLPPVDPKERHALRPEDVDEILGQNENVPPKKPHKKFDGVPKGFKPSPRASQKLQERPSFRLPSKKETLPPINSSNNYIPTTVKKPVKYEPPFRKQNMPWKEPKVEKVSAKTLDDISTKHKPTTNPAYMDNYGGGYYDDNDYYDDHYHQPPQPVSTYKQGRKDREHLRGNNKFNTVQNQHHYPSRKRNQPVY